MPDEGSGLRVNSRLVVPWHEIEVESARAGGPGGQRVNKVATKIVLRFSVRDSEALGDARRARLLEALRPRLTSAGVIVIHASRFRERSRNLEDARERLAELLRQGLTVAKPRKATRPTKGSQRRRLEEKKRRGATKRSRRGETD